MEGSVADRFPPLLRRLMVQSINEKRTWSELCQNEQLSCPLKTPRRQNKEPGLS